MSGEKFAEKRAYSSSLGNWRKLVRQLVEGYSSHRLGSERNRRTFGKATAEELSSNSRNHACKAMAVECQSGTERSLRPLPLNCTKDFTPKLK